MRLAVQAAGESAKNVGKVIAPAGTVLESWAGQGHKIGRDKDREGSETERDKYLVQMSGGRTRIGQWHGLRRNGAGHLVYAKNQGHVDV